MMPKCLEKFLYSLSDKKAEKVYNYLMDEPLALEEMIDVTETQSEPPRKDLKKKAKELCKRLKKMRKAKAS